MKCVCAGLNTLYQPACQQCVAVWPQLPVTTDPLLLRLPQRPVCGLGCSPEKRLHPPHRHWTAQLKHNH